MVYFYAPSIEIETEELMEATGKPQIDPAELDSEGELIPAELCAGMTSPKYDRELKRFVLACKMDSDPRPGWEVKTIQEVNTDYPGLLEE